MAKLSREDVLKLAKLSRLQLTDEDVVSFQNEISTALGYVEQLQQVDLDDIEPTYQLSGLKDVTRPDEIKDYGYTADDLLANSNVTEEGYIKVKRMLA